MTKLSFTVDPDEMDELIASELRQCYKTLARFRDKDEDCERTKEAILVVLEHYMPLEKYDAWYETIKEL